MTTVDSQIRNADQAICDNIATLSDNRALLSQNLLSQARNLVEAIAVRIHSGDGSIEFSYDATKAALAFVGSGNNGSVFCIASTSSFRSAPPITRWTATRPSA